MMPDDTAGDWRTLESFAFGDRPELADELLQLVLDGRKTATCWAASDGPSTHVGKRMVVLDGSGRPRAVLETIELSQRCFDEIDAAWAFDEGENDRSLEGWRQAHRNYFTRLGQFTPDMPLYCEHFRVVALIGAKRERCGGDRDMAPVEPSAPCAPPAYRGRGRRGPGG